MAASPEVIVVGPASPYRGGIANYTGQLSTSLNEVLPTEIVNFTYLYPEILFPGKTQFAPNPQELSVPNTRKLSSANPLTWYSVSSYINERSPRAVIFQWWHPFFAPAYHFIARRVGSEHTSIIFLCHNVEPHESSFFDKQLLRYAYNPVKKFLVQSSLEMERLLEYKPNAETRVHTHPVYSFFPEPAPDMIPPVEIPETEITLLYFGLIRPYKGLHVLLEAMPKILESLDTHLLVVGEFYEEKEGYLQQIQELGLSNDVTVVDEYVPDAEVGWYFQNADIVVLPYLNATQSGIIPIAYHFNRPVIATEVGGLPDVVFEDETGYLVPPNDAVSLAGAVYKYSEQRNSIDFRGNIVKHLDMFSWDSLRDTLLKLI
ncbi:MAG: glycosyltransferase [Candidatus Marinimicrobia bacterium]|nr:glycosyltransferase [Candidatus Neomarinimicrobiota bacterium]MCF7829827.1 glycosyltransferase [Candidatus Neomarinimicrobiota bacterium]MCF7881740.1 glycosyltransferase [Candidatus Neomarinimicrobiota bacterium]